MNEISLQVPVPVPAAFESQSRRRLVVAIGPPKTASTSLQNFLATYASTKNPSGSSPKLDAFSRWSYPLFFGRDNGFKELGKGYDHPDFSVIKNKVQKVSSSTNLVLVSEYMINYKTWLNGNLWQELSNWTGGASPEIVVVSRTPRTSHLLSIWKQLTQVSTKPTYASSFQELMCNMDFSKTVEQRIGSFANPLGLAYDLIFTDNLPVYILDSGGVAELGLDICHAFSCSVLKVNCTDDRKWVQGLEGVTIRSNIRKGDAGLSLEKATQLDRLFQQRDCAYFDDLHNHSMFHLLYQSDYFWPDKCAGDIRSVPVYRDNVTVMLEDFRRILECPGYEPQHENGTNPNVTRLEAEYQPLQNALSVQPTVVLPNAQIPQIAVSIMLFFLFTAVRLRLLTGSRRPIRCNGASVTIDHS